MRLPDEILNSVCFLCVKITNGQYAGRYQSFGTGFFIAINEWDMGFCYLVTARHVIDEVKRLKYETIYIRMNKQDGSSSYVELPDIATWVLPTDKGLDIAIMPFKPDLDVFNNGLMSLDILVTDPVIIKNAIGIGDDLFVVGLFVLHTGKSRNIPIVRSGIISAMPHEPLLSKEKHPFLAYLVEMRSIGGLSGSPVFVVLQKNRVYRSEANDMEEDGFRYFLLGLIRGHWDLKREDNFGTDDSASEDAFGTDDNSNEDAFLGYNQGEKMNVGIAVVTPAHYIHEIFMHPSAVKNRKDIAALTKNLEIK